MRLSEENLPKESVTNQELSTQDLFDKRLTTQLKMTIDKKTGLRSFTIKNGEKLVYKKTEKRSLTF